jgi:hypothetical protein
VTHFCTSVFFLSGFSNFLQTAQISKAETCESLQAAYFNYGWCWIVSTQDPTLAAPTSKTIFSELLYYRLQNEWPPQSAYACTCVCNTHTHTHNFLYVILLKYFIYKHYSYLYNYYNNTVISFENIAPITFSEVSILIAECSYSKALLFKTSHYFLHY